MRTAELLSIVSLITGVVPAGRCADSDATSRHPQLSGEDEHSGAHEHTSSPSAEVRTTSSSPVTGMVRSRMVRSAASRSGPSSRSAGR